MNIGEIIYSTRKAQGKSRERLEAESGVSVTTILSIERGRGMHIDTLLLLCDALGLELKIERKAA